MSHIVGLDLSLSCTGFARIAPDGELVTAAIVTSPDINTTLRTVEITRQLFIRMEPTDIVFLEDYAFAAPGQITKLAELGGVVKAMLYRLTNLLPMLVTTQQMRKFINGENKLKKDMIPRAVLQAFGVAPETHDECVALVIALMGRMVVDPTAGTSSPKYRLDVVAKVREKNKEIMQALAK